MKRFCDQGIAGQAHLLLQVCFLVVLIPLASFGQGVRMSADFLPLDVGNRWIYDVSNEGGQKMGQLTFAVEEYTIISGRSFYVFTEFPFTAETGSRIKFIRYDRQERHFIRMIGNDEGPLFLSDGASTEVLQADAAGLPEKFTLKTETLSLTFQRGVGIVEARFQTSEGLRIAKVASVEGKGLTSGTSAPSAVSTAPRLPPTVAPPEPVAQPARRVETVTTVTDSNPRLEVSGIASAEGYKLVLVVTNASDKLLPFKFNSGQSYDFVIQDSVTGREIWRWSRDQFFTQVIRSEALRGNGKWTYEVVWNRRDNEGMPVSPGQYHLIGIVSSQPPIPSPRTILDVQ